MKSKFDNEDDKISKNDGPSRKFKERPEPKIRKDRLEPFDKSQRRIPIDWFIDPDELDLEEDEEYDDD